MSPNGPLAIIRPDTDAFSRAVPSNVELEMLVSGPSDQTLPRIWAIVPGVVIVSLSVYPDKFKPLKLRVVLYLRTRKRRIFKMNGVEFSVPAVIGIEIKRIEPATVTGFGE